jgi:hypothetical protein
MLPSPFYRDSITLITDLIRTQQKQENYRPISIVNLDIQILNKIHANLIQQHISNIIHHNQTGFIPEM